MPSRRSITAALLCIGMLAPVPAGAQESAAAPEPLPIWERSFYKTLTYQTLANLSDFALYGVVLGGSAATGAGFVAVNTASAAALYYSYEYLWESYGPPPEQKSHAMIVEKTVYYRALSSAKNFALGYAFVGNVGAAAGFVASSFLADTAIFLGNEYAWDLFRPRAGVAAATMTVSN